jgi:hypothetical protein
MSNKVYEVTLKHELPTFTDQGKTKRLSSSACAIHAVICYRYDERKTLTNGKPNRGYGKSYPGINELRLAIGNKSRQAVEIALSELIRAGLIIRVTIGKPGQQAEFVPVWALSILGECVSHNLHVSKKLPPVKVAEYVSDSPEMCKQSLPNMSTMTDTISNTSNHKNDKYQTKDRLDIKWERWNVVSANLNPHVKRKFQPSKESEHLLDVILERPGITATGLRDRLGAINFATSTNNTGLLMNYLRELSGAKEANKSHHRTAWCGKCEKVSRTYAEQGPGNDGKLTYDCPTCNDNQVRVKEREVINDPELLKQFGWNTFGSIPD